MAKCASSAEAVHEIKVDLAAEVLGTGSRIRLRAFGTSMLPSIWPGDVLTIAPYIAAEVAVGDIICVRESDRLIIHRLIGSQEVSSGSCGEREVFWITRGDSAKGEDSAISERQILGHITAIRRNGRWIRPSRRLSPLARRCGCLLEQLDWLQGTVLRVRRLLRRCTASNSQLRITES